MTEGPGIDVLPDPGAERERQFRRFVAISAAAHLVLAGLFLFAPTPRRTTVLPGVVRVDLVAAPAPAPPAAAKPEPKPAPPKPRPAPKPKPKPPVPEKVVLPEKPVAKPEPRPEPKPAEPAVAPEAPAEDDIEYDDLMEQLRKEAGEDAPAAPSQVAGTGGVPGGGRGALVSPEVMAWMRKAKVHVTRAWVLAPGFRSQPLETEITVTLGPAGDVRRTRITRGSGNPWFDESVERAIQKASPLPAPPEADEWSFVFRPQDLL